MNKNKSTGTTMQISTQTPKTFDKEGFESLEWIDVGWVTSKPKAVPYNVFAMDESSNEQT